MARQTQKRFPRNTRSTTRAKQTRMPVVNNGTTPVRRPIKPSLTEQFHVAVDRQLKSGYDTYDEAEQAALKIKNRYPQLHVTVFDAKEGRHKLIEKPVTGTTNNYMKRHAGRNAAAPLKPLAASVESARRGR